ncbi:MAG: DUF1015 domain-containing protein [Spirochaetes bacterium]|nr:DUF1015 domain-containing protein [Spirochaetota bacterium]
MAVIRGFCGVRYDTPRLSPDDVTAPPYDVISPSERDAFIARHENNVVRLILGKEQPGDAPGSDKYSRARGYLDAWLSSGALVSDDTPCYYLLKQEYRDRFGRERSTMGFIGELELSRFGEGIVFPHEKTLAKPKADRFNLMSATQANLSQIFLLYRDNERSIVDMLNGAVQGAAPLFTFTDSFSVTNTFWKTPASQLPSLARAFVDKQVYIADGHHRYETSVRYRDTMREQGAPIGGKQDFAMVYLTDADDDALSIYPTHRLVNGIAAEKMNALPEALKKLFDVHTVARDGVFERMAGKPHAFGLFTGGNNVLLITLKSGVDLAKEIPDTLPAVRILDVSVLHVLILDRLLGIDRTRLEEQTNLTYTRDDDKAFAAVEHGEAQAAFLLNPTPLDSVLTVADSSGFMPQKSTYFVPKLPSGLVFRLMR